MRKDMDKVVTERPRVGGRSPVKGRAANRSLEDLPQKESMRKKWVAGGNPKEFSDLINPLRRFLNKQVGKPWDKVYSEIVASLPGGLSGIHILDHIKWEVEIHAVVDGKTPCYGHGRLYGVKLRRGSLYVNPKSGLLCRAK